MSMFVNLGPIIWVLIIFSILVVTVTLLKLWQWVGLRRVYSATANAAVKEAIGVNNNQINDPDNIRLALIARYQHVANKIAQPSQIHSLETEVWRIARGELDALGHFMKVLEVIATVAPLVGLPGTVVGMVEAFQAMELAGSNVNPAVLSGGIWKALLTTAAGLIVAIPAFIAHSWFERKTERAAGMLQDDLELFLANQAQKA